MLNNTNRLMIEEGSFFKAMPNSVFRGIQEDFDDLCWMIVNGMDDVDKPETCKMVYLGRSKTGQKQTVIVHVTRKKSPLDTRGDEQAVDRSKPTSG
jgi:hypothetical protein